MTKIAIPIRDHAVDDHFGHCDHYMKGLFLLIIFLACASSFAQPSRDDLRAIKVGKDGNFRYWKQDSPSLMALRAFVSKVTDETSESFVPVCDRIAAFDIDGTMMCETAPSYMGMNLYIYRHFQDPSYTPEEEGKEVAELIRGFLAGEVEGTTELNIRFHKQNQLSFAGMSQREYCDYVKAFVSSAKVSGYNNLTWECAIYWPMLEVVSYLQSNDFTVFFVSGSERDACRVLFCDITDIPPYHVLGSDVHYVMEGQEGITTEQFDTESYPYVPGERVERGEMHVINTSVNKLACITRNIGKQPILSWGNSSGDYPMFHHTQTDNPYPSIVFCNLCDDTVRENGNTSKATKVANKCKEYGWNSVSMRNEWTTIYGDEVLRDNPTAIQNVEAQNAPAVSYDLTGKMAIAPKSNSIIVWDGKKVLTQ